MANEPWNESEEELRKRGYEKTDDGKYVDKYGDTAQAEGKFIKEDKDPYGAPWTDVSKNED